MSFCPDCEYEYQDTTTVCPECGSALVDELTEQPPYMCDECKTPLEGEVSWCPECGVAFSDIFLCFNHPDVAAHGRCVVCRQHLCASCTVRRMGRFLCAHDAGDERPSYTSDVKKTEGPDWEAEKFKRFLNTASIPSRVISAQDMRRIRFSGDIAAIKLIASRAHRRAVKEVLKERDIGEMIALFECARCSAISGYDEPACPNCEG